MNIKKYLRGEDRHVGTARVINKGDEMKIHKRRYLNALKKAAKINRYLKKGYHVFYDGDRIDRGFVLEDNQIVLKLSDNFSVRFYENSPDWDHGYWTSIKKYNEAFSEDFEVYKPSARIEL